MYCCSSKKSSEIVDPVSVNTSIVSNNMAYQDNKGFNTIALRSGHKLDTDNRARAPPIFQSTSFEFKSAEHGAQLFALAELGPIYTRETPTPSCPRAHHPGPPARSSCARRYHEPSVPRA